MPCYSPSFTRVLAPSQVVGVRDFRTINSMTSSRCSIGGDNGRRGAGRRERRTEGAAEKKKWLVVWKGREHEGFYQALCTHMPYLFIYIYIYVYIYIYMISTPDTQIQIFMTLSSGVSKITSDQGGVEPPEQFVLQTTWVRKTTTPHPVGNWSFHLRDPFFNHV